MRFCIGHINLDPVKPLIVDADFVANEIIVLCFIQRFISGVFELDYETIVFLIQIRSMQAKLNPLLNRLRRHARR